MAKKIPWWKRYYNSDSASSLFVPATGANNTRLFFSQSSRLRRDARKKYALNQGKIKLMQFIFWVLTAVLVASVLGIMELLQRFYLKPIVHGVAFGLLFGVLFVAVFFVLPVIFEQYCYKKGWLKKTVKSNQKRR